MDENELNAKIADARKRGNRRDEAEYLESLGAHYINRGRPSQAITPLREALEVRKGLRDAQEAAWCCSRLSEIYWAKPYYPVPGLGNPQVALAYGEEAVQRAEDTRQKVQYLNGLMGKYALLGNLQRAIQLYDLACQYDPEQGKDRDRSLRILRQMADEGYR